MKSPGVSINQPPPVIGIDASRSTVPQRSGTENYSLQIIRALINTPSRYTWKLYFRDKPIPSLFPRTGFVDSVVIPSPLMWTHLRLSIELALNPPNVIFIPSHVRPIYCKVPSVVTVHDLGFIHHPNMHPPLQLAYLRWSTNHNITKANHLLADSEATKNDIIKQYNTDPAKITVVYPGFDSKPYNMPKEIGHIPDLPEPYILYVGTLHPRKGLSDLINALAELRDHNIKINLVCAGRDGWMMSTIRSQIEKLGLVRRVYFLGFVPQEHLPLIYSRAKLSVLPSLYEGFGYTTLESMASGTPVICTSAGSLPEVVGDAALTVQPGDSSSLADAINTVLTNESLRQNLINKGLKRCTLFPWSSTANQTLAIIEQVLSAKNNHVSTKPN